jgi:hypothetical protein
MLEQTRAPGLLEGGAARSGELLLPAQALAALGTTRRRERLAPLRLAAFGGAALARAGGCDRAHARHV